MTCLSGALFKEEGLLQYIQLPLHSSNCNTARLLTCSWNIKKCKIYAATLLELLLRTLLDILLLCRHYFQSRDKSGKVSQLLSRFYLLFNVLYVFQFNSLIKYIISTFFWFSFYRWTSPLHFRDKGCYGHFLFSKSVCFSLCNMIRN